MSLVTLIFLVHFFRCGPPTSLRERLCVHHQLFLGRGIGGGRLAQIQRRRTGVRLFFFQAPSLQMCPVATIACPFFFSPGAGRRGVNWRRLMEATSAPFTSPAWCLMRAAWSRSTTCRGLICRSVAARMKTPAGCWSKNTHLRTTVGSVCVCVHAVSAQVCLVMNVPS